MLLESAPTNFKIDWSWRFYQNITYLPNYMGHTPENYNLDTALKTSALTSTYHMHNKVS